MVGTAVALLILRPLISAALWAAILCLSSFPLFLRLQPDARRTPLVGHADCHAGGGRYNAAPLVIL